MRKTFAYRENWHIEIKWFEGQATTWIQDGTQGNVFHPAYQTTVDLRNPK